MGARGRGAVWGDEGGNSRLGARGTVSLAISQVGGSWVWVTADGRDDFVVTGSGSHR
ncbi:hypothetical protein TIFTF001_008366 [Ficus carica]|uniref:Uncharacterized protein n=1 Tax=Ficus carica TaxID=3494 RepID=A0AA88DH12_FICCA|nr:hypothetical protein TIFTF001_008366 [Ficus carica]